MIRMRAYSKLIKCDNCAELDFWVSSKIFMYLLTDNILWPFFLHTILKVRIVYCEWCIRELQVLAGLFKFLLPQFTQPRKISITKTQKVKFVVLTEMANTWYKKHSFIIWVCNNIQYVLIFYLSLYIMKYFRLHERLI